MSDSSEEDVDETPFGIAAAAGIGTVHKLVEFPSTRIDSQSGALQF